MAKGEDVKGVTASLFGLTAMMEPFLFRVIDMIGVKSMKPSNKVDVCAECPYFT